jgi:hypothetical protein
MKKNIAFPFLLFAILVGSQFSFSQNSVKLTSSSSAGIRPDTGDLNSTAQKDVTGIPASTNVQGAEYPQILPDNRAVLKRPKLKRYKSIAERNTKW